MSKGMVNGCMEMQGAMTPGNAKTPGALVVRNYQGQWDQGIAKGNE